MPREHNEDGKFRETVTHDDVMRLFEAVEGPVILTSDVADAEGCTTQTARSKLKELQDAGRVGCRSVAGRTVYWRTE